MPSDGDASNTAAEIAISMSMPSYSETRYSFYFNELIYFRLVYCNGIINEYYFTVIKKLAAIQLYVYFAVKQERGCILGIKHCTYRAIIALRVP